MWECVCYTGAMPASPHSRGPVACWRYRNAVVCRRLGGRVLLSVFFSVVSNIYKFLALNSIFRKKQTRCCCAGSLDGDSEVLLWDSLATQLSLVEWLLH